MFSPGIVEMARRWAHRIEPHPRTVDVLGLGQDDYAAIFLETAWRAMRTLRNRYPDAGEIDLLRYSRAAMRKRACEAMENRIRKARLAKACGESLAEWSLYGIQTEEQGADPVRRLEVREQLWQLEQRLPGWAASVQQALEVRDGRRVYNLRQLEKGTRDDARSC